MVKSLKYIFLFFISIQLHSQSVGGNTSGSVSFCANINSGFISLSGHVGTIQHWQSSNNSGASWIFISNPTNTQNYSNLTQTTWFRAVVKNGAFPTDTSSISIVTIFPAAVGGNVVGGGAFCLSAPASSLTLNGNLGTVSFWQSSITNGSSWVNIASTSTTLPYSTITQNTLYRAIIQNVVSCPSATSSIVSFSISQATNAGTLYQNDTVCNGDNADTLRLIGQVGVITKWIKSTNAGATWTSIANTTPKLPYLNLTQTTLYGVINKNGSCPADTTNYITISIVNANLANAGADVTITQFETTNLNGSGNGIPLWHPTLDLSDSTIFTPAANPLHTISYVLTLTDSFGCTSKDTVIVNVIVPVPTAITPNGDGVNDYFLIDKIGDYPQNNIVIFNRWGNVVFKEAPYTNTWNGKSKSGSDLPDGIYYHTFDFGNGEKAITGYILIKR
jgi:gliding motility-associated-like protein